MWSVLTCKTPCLTRCQVKINEHSFHGQKVLLHFMKIAFDIPPFKTGRFITTLRPLYLFCFFIVQNAPYVNLSLCLSRSLTLFGPACNPNSSIRNSELSKPEIQAVEPKSYWFVRFVACWFCVQLQFGNRHWSFSPIAVVPWSCRLIYCFCHS